MKMNIKPSVQIHSYRKTAKVLRAISQMNRLRILVLIGSGETCACHLEAALHLRQSYISQHLMALRHAGIVVTRREGRNVYYRIKDPAFLQVIDCAAKSAGVSISDLRYPDRAIPLPGCTCPHCAPSTMVDFPRNRAIAADASSA
jgi:ArsR family transcriptional regulator